MTHRIAVFASGSGTNAENLIQYFSGHEQIKVVKVYSNRADAFVHQRAVKHGVPSETFSKAEFRSPDFVRQLKEEGISCIVLAGFLWLIPGTLVDAYQDHIINIHPALLPDFGGKGMYGNYVHEAVIASGVSISGITIHLVNERYDEGEVLFQAKTEVKVNDDVNSLAKRIHQLEYEHFPKVVETHLLKE